MASYAFRIHNPRHPGDTAPASPTTMSGWTVTQHIAGNLLKNIPIGIHNTKMGTSIPSIFARIYLFESAFQSLSGANIQALRANTSDTQLVSECLDLIEFVYQHANDPKLVIKHWNSQTQTTALRNDGIAEHKLLADVLEDEVRNSGNLLDDIFLFYWKDTAPGALAPKEFLIGGTSPFTLAYTSPNWKKTVRQNGFVFNRLDGSPMFGDHNGPLDQRDSSFKDMLYSLLQAYNPELNAQSNSFLSYLNTMWNGDFQSPTVLAMGANPAQFLHDYKLLQTTDGTLVHAGALPIAGPSADSVVDQSGYEIVPKSTRYANYIAKDGTAVHIDPPLVLNDNGLPNVPYIGNSTWNARTCVINAGMAIEQEMHKRTLPGFGGIQYPYLVWSDFLQEKIIKVPYDINDDKFTTAFNGTTKYLLPLKREFFNYFNIEDIERKACDGSDKKLVEISIHGDKVVVSINVPIRDQTYKTIELRQEYSGNKIVEANFTLGFFPFYRCTEERLNRYNVLNCGNGTSIKFFNIDNGIASPFQSSSTIRTPQQNIISQTEYHSVTHSFDFIEVERNGTTGLVIPKMQAIDTNDPAHVVQNLYEFGVDFGTSNTYIAHTTQGNPNPQTLEIDDHDQQTVYLNKGNDLGGLGIMQPYMEREFAPLRLGAGWKIGYPARTATCEIQNFSNRQPELFGTISIGFNMMHEPVVSDRFKYKTGLKWLLENNPGNTEHTNRVKYYFLQTLWMLKNESLMNGGTDDFTVYITLPEAMRNPGALTSLWTWAKNELQINCELKWGTSYSESIAPYNCMVNEIQGASYVNIDIGGGTNDILFVIKDNAGQIDRCHYSSAKFAGDDLWGDGVQIANVNNMDNGFLNYVYSEIENAQNAYDPAILQPLEALKNGIGTSSADIMSYLFKYDNIFQTSEKIKGQRNLYSLIFIHYSALIYNVARIINKLGIDIPECVSFTGMGSKYINLISDDTNVVREFTKLLLEKFTNKEVSPGFQIIHPAGIDVKEITAKGVLKGLNIHQNFRIPNNILSPVVDYGFDTERLKYKDIRNKETGQKVKSELMNSFKRFLESLQDEDIKQFIFVRFGLSISQEILEDLSVKAEGSYTAVAASISNQYDDINVTETLLFWPLKNSLIELSKKYDQYN